MKCVPTEDIDESGGFQMFSGRRNSWTETLNMSETAVILKCDSLVCRMWFCKDFLFCRFLYSSSLLLCGTVLSLH